MPNTNRNYLQPLTSLLIWKTSYDTNELNIYIVNNEFKLNHEQSMVCITVYNSVGYGTIGAYFLNAPGGTGKTFLINLILANIKSNKMIALAVAVASSGIDATLFSSEKTAHSTIKLSLDLTNDDETQCNVYKNSTM